MAHSLRCSLAKRCSADHQITVPLCVKEGLTGPVVLPGLGFRLRATSLRKVVEENAEGHHYAQSGYSASSAVQWQAEGASDDGQDDCDDDIEHQH
jgi:hypothetical protein